MSKNKEEISLRVVLKGQVLKKFRDLKGRYGLENDTELVRLLIAEEYKRQFGEL
jgi:hypothetical protein